MTHSSEPISTSFTDSVISLPTSRYSSYVLILMLLTYTSAQVDRGIMGILGQAIKVEMGLADWQLGLLTGFAFTIFYSILGFPLARIAETKSRVNVIVVCLVLWSGMTALCGLASGFLMLVLLRCMVGVGEAGCAPGCQSLISDYFEPKKRTFAFAVYAIAVPLGAMLGAILGGVLTQYIGWRMAMVCVGLPGLGLALLIKLTVKEPARGRMDATPEVAVAPRKTPSLAEVWRTLLAKSTFRHIAASLSLLGFAGGVVGAFLGPYYIRQFHLNFAEVGLIIGLMTGTTAVLGTLVGGHLAQRLGTKNAKWYMLVPAIGLAAGVPFAIAGYLQNVWWATAAFLLVPGLLQGSFLASAFAATHNMVSADMRASAAATIYFFMNIIGMAMGPVLGGLAIDLISNHMFGDRALGEFAALCPGGVAGATASIAVKAACASVQATATQSVLLMTTPLTLWASIHYYLGSRSIRRDLIESATPQPQT